MNHGNGFRDLTGVRFGILTVVKLSILSRPKKLVWDCLCDCGKSKPISRSSLTGGKVKSCGCGKSIWCSQANVTHGQARRKNRSAEYSCWSAMLKRCRNPNDWAFRWYGGRGISVCSRWVESFQNFFDDMGTKPIGTTLDRIDFNGNYEPANCRWSNSQIQALNRRGSLNTYDQLMAELTALKKENSFLRSLLKP